MSSESQVNAMNQSDTQAKSSEVLVNLSLNPSSVSLSPDVNVSPELLPNRSNQSIPLLNIVSVPNLPKRKTRESLRKKHSTIITSSPMRDFLKDKEQKKSMKEQEVKKISVKKKKVGSNFNKFEANNEPKKKIITRDDKENDCYCLICEEKYHDPPTEDWIMCYKCKSWSHEKCTSCASTSRGFLCDFCT